MEEFLTLTDATDHLRRELDRTRGKLEVCEEALLRLAETKDPEKVLKIISRERKYLEAERAKRDSAREAWDKRWGERLKGIP